MTLSPIVCDRATTDVHAKDRAGSAFIPSSYLFFVLALIVGISAATVAVNAGPGMHDGDQGGNDDSPGQ